MTTYYLDYENGIDSGTGADWANAWKTITLGATAARIVPGDIIRIAKSPAPTALAGTTATWTNLSKTVTLNTAETANIDLCETAWTANGSGDVTVTRTSTITEGKEGSYSMSFSFDAAVQTSTMQAYYQISDTDFSAYQKMSFWIYNQGAVTAGTLRIALCSDTAGATPVDYFDIPANPSTSQWMPLTLTKSGGGNLGASIQSIALYTNSAVTGLASKLFYVDDFIACTTSGLNLQSLISKNTLEQSSTSSANYGNEGWYGIQSINGVTVMLDTKTDTKANDGQGYTTSGTSPETVNTFIRETIKTDMVQNNNTSVQEVKDSGTLGNDIEFQGGYNTSDSTQDGETFFDGLNGYGEGLIFTGKKYVTLNRLNFYRYYDGLKFYNKTYNITATHLSNISNNSYAGIIFNSEAANNRLVYIGNANNNNNYGIYFESGCYGNQLTTINNANGNNQAGIAFSSAGNNFIGTLTSTSNNKLYGVYFYYGGNNIINTLTRADDNDVYGIYFYYQADNNLIRSLSTTGNNTSSIGTFRGGKNFIGDATLNEGTKFTADTYLYGDTRVSINNIGGYSNILTDGGTIVSQDATAGGTGLEWKFSPTDTSRDIYYPLKLSIAKIAVVANKAVDVSAYFKKSHATDIEGYIVCRGGQLAGIASDIKTVIPSDTNRNSVALASMTPTEAGVIEIEAWAYWVANAADETVIVDDITVTQEA